MGNKEGFWKLKETRGDLWRPREAWGDLWKQRETFRDQGILVGSQRDLWRPKKEFWRPRVGDL